MTTFTAPLHVKSPWSTDTTVATVDASVAQFIGIAKAGPNNDTIGDMLMVQMASIASNTSGASGIRLPANSHGADIWLIVRASASANIQGMNVRIGTSADATRFATIKGSAPNIYRIGVAPNATAVSAAAFGAITSDTQLHIDVTAAASAGQVDGFEAILYVSYVRKS